MAFLGRGQIHFHQEMARKPHTKHRQANALAQFQPQHRQADGNAQTGGHHHIQIAVVRVIVVVHIARKAQVGVEKVVELAQLVQSVCAGQDAALQSCRPVVHVAEHLLNVQRGKFILRQADGGFQQGELVVTLHQTGEVVQGAGGL